MSSSPNLISCLALVSSLTALLSHWFYFVRGEHHTYAMSYFIILIVVVLAMISSQHYFWLLPFRQACSNAGSIVAAYAATLSCSIVTYRLYFHPLRHFQGPRSMRISKLGHAFRSRKLDNHHQIDRLYESFGDFVRTGPNELTIFRPEAYAALHGAQSKCTKSDRYDVLKPSHSMHSTRTKADHGKRKRVWDHAFSVKGERIFCSPRSPPKSFV